jgi:CBS domain-containing protein
MKIGPWMKTKVISVEVTATILDAAQLFRSHHIGTLPVVDGDGRLVGIVPLHTVLHLIMPVFVDLIQDFDYVGDFGVMEEQGPAPEELNRPISQVMTPPVSVQEESGLLRAFAFIHKHQLLDLPVVDQQDRLVGLASRVDIGRALLANWWPQEPLDPTP